MSVRGLQRRVHAACRALGLDEETRRDLQLAACGKASMRDMDAADLERVLARLRRCGWKDGVERDVERRVYKRAPRGDLRLVHVLWRKLGEAGVVREPGRAGLNRFVRARFEGVWRSVPIDVDTLRDHRQIAQVITALKDWCAREGVELEP